MLNGCVCAVLCAAGACMAQDAVVNGGFESPVLNPNGFSVLPPTGWLHAAGGTVGIFYPTQQTWSYVAPEGNQVLYTNTAMAEQRFCDTLMPNRTYTLSVDIVHRPGFFNGYTVEMRAGDVVLMSDTNSLNPPVGGFEVLVLEYTAAPDDPALGQQLSIRLGGPQQANFDEASFTGTCRVDCNADGNLNILDFVCYQQQFSAGEDCADCNEDGVLNILDFVCFQGSFAAGCD